MVNDLLERTKETAPDLFFSLLNSIWVHNVESFEHGLKNYLDIKCDLFYFCDL